MARGERLIFVGGAGRSGTTLLQNILDSHPDIVGGPEFRQIPDIIYLRNKLHDSIAAGKTVVFNSYDDINTQIYTLIENLLMPLLKKHNCKFLSEKTPANIFVFPELMKLLPGAHFIFMLRDPRANISSQMVAKKKGKASKSKRHNGPSSQIKLSVFDFLTLTMRVKNAILAGLSASTIEPSKVLIVSYEKLVTAPEKETKKMCDFLGVEWFPQMLYPSKQQHIGEEAMTVARGNKWFTKENFNRDPDLTSLNKWKSQLTSFQKAVILFFFKDIKELALNGYDLTAQHFGEKALMAILSFFSKIVQWLRKLSKFVAPLKAVRRLGRL